MLFCRRVKKKKTKQTYLVPCYWLWMLCDEAEDYICTFDSENGLLSLKQTGFFLQEALRSNRHGAKSCCLSLFELVWASGDVFWAHTAGRGGHSEVDQEPVRGIMSSTCPWKDLVVCERSWRRQLERGRSWFVKKLEVITSRLFNLLNIYIRNRVTAETMLANK